MDLTGLRIALYGRLMRHARARVAEAMTARGGAVERDLTRRSDILVIGRGALGLIPTGHLSRKIRQAAVQAVPVIGEDRLSAALEGRDEPAPTVPLARAPTVRTVLLDLMNAFDIVHLADGACRFADIKTMRDAAALDGAGHEPSSVVRVLLRARDVAPTGRHRIVTDGAEPMLAWDDGVTGLDGQGLLSLPAQPGLEEAFEAAMLAEAEGDLDAAARGYALSAQIDRRDPIAPFNLGNVLARKGAHDDAIHRFGQAIARDPGFSEALHNRARAYEASGNTARAIADLREAIRIDPGYSDALFNLAQLLLAEGQAGEAVALFERFLALDPEGEWQKIARQARAVALANIGQTE